MSLHRRTESRRNINDLFSESSETRGWIWNERITDESQSHDNEKES